MRKVHSECDAEAKRDEDYPNRDRPGQVGVHMCTRLTARARSWWMKMMTRRALARYMRDFRAVLAWESWRAATHHHWARMLRALGHDDRLMSRRFVKRYGESNKNDVSDAGCDLRSGIAPQHAGSCRMKSVEQQDVQHVHRVRSQAVAHRCGAGQPDPRARARVRDRVCGGQRSALRSRLPEPLEDADRTGSAARGAELVGGATAMELRRLDERVALIRGGEDAAQTSAVRRRRAPEELRRGFREGRAARSRTELLVAAARGWLARLATGATSTAWVGVVPRQRSTGGSERELLGISNRGYLYLRVAAQSTSAYGQRCERHRSARLAVQSMGLLTSEPASRHEGRDHGSWRTKTYERRGYCLPTSSNMRLRLRRQSLFVPGGRAANGCTETGTDRWSRPVGPTDTGAADVIAGHQGRQSDESGRERIPSGHGKQQACVLRGRIHGINHSCLTAFDSSDADGGPAIQ